MPVWTFTKSSTVKTFTRLVLANTSNQNDINEYSKNITCKSANLSDIIDLYIHCKGALTFCVVVF